MEYPELISFWTPDEVAECLPVSRDTYAELWAALAATEESKRKPLGGDGTDGTIEVPVHDEKYGPRSWWAKLSEHAQRDVIEAVENELS